MRRRLVLQTVLLWSMLNWGVPPMALAIRAWEPVTAEELAARSCPFDSTADLEALFWRTWIQDEIAGSDWKTTRRHEVRLKVYSQEAAQSLTSISIDVRSQDALILDLEARTISPDGHVTEMDPRSVSRATVVKLKDHEIKRITFAPPAVRAGCIVEYRYREVWEGALIVYEDHWLQQPYPVRRLQYFLSPATAPMLRQRQVTFHAQTMLGKTTADGFIPLELRDVPAWKREPWMPSEKQTRAWMLLFYTDQPVTHPSKYWTQVGDQTAKWVDEWCQVDRDLKKAAADAVADATTDAQKVERLVAWCRRSVRVARSTDPDSLKKWRIRENSDARSTLDQRAGQPVDVDLLFLTLARAVGLRAQYLSVSQRERFHFTQEMMAPGLLDSYQIAVLVDGNWRVVDPQHEWLPWDMVAANEEERIGLLCLPDSSRFLEIGSSGPDRSIRRRTGLLSLDEEGTLSGQVEVEWSGHWNAEARGQLKAEPDPMLAFRTSVDWKDPRIELENLQYIHGSDTHEPLRAKARITIRNAARPAGAQLLLEPSVWWAMRSPGFLAGERTWPVEFPFRWTESDSVRIRVPEGWTVGNALSPRALSGGDAGQVSIQLRALEDGRVVECIRQQMFAPSGPRTYAPTEYAVLKRYDEAVLDRDRTSVAVGRANGPSR